MDREMKLATQQRLSHSTVASVQTSFPTTRGYESQIGVKQLEVRMRKSSDEYEQFAGGDASDVGGAASYWLAGQISEQPSGIQRGLQNQMGPRTSRIKDGRHIASLDNRTVASQTKGNRFYRGDLHADPRRVSSIRNDTSVSEVICIDGSDCDEDHRPAKRVGECMEDTPPRLICPITRQIYRDPVIASDGFTYERFALQQLLDGSRIPNSPLTRERLNLQIFPNRDMQQQVEQWWFCKPSPPLEGTESGRRESPISSSSGPPYANTPAVRYCDTNETSGASSSVPYYLNALSDESNHSHGSPGPSHVLDRNTKFDCNPTSCRCHTKSREFVSYTSDASSDATGSESTNVVFQRPRPQETRAASQQHSCDVRRAEEPSEPNNMTALRAARLARFDK